MGLDLKGEVQAMHGVEVMEIHWYCYALIERPKNYGHGWGCSKQKWLGLGS